MNVAVPWNLSPYVPFDGFRPLYRALFDHAPPDIRLVAWDTVKLHRHFASSATDRERVLGLAKSHQHSAVEAESIADSRIGHIYPPDRVLAEALDGEIEFHHTAPFASPTRPFVLHCESLAEALFPSTHQGQARFEKHDELRLHYGRLFRNPLCQGIYSHIPETLHDLSHFFSDSTIDEKLFHSKIGLSGFAITPGLIRPRQPIDRPRFLFIESAGPTDFFDQGGHIVLRFWKEFRSAGREGTLVLRCRRPDDETLTDHGVDSAFVQSEIGRSILWSEAHLSNRENGALMAAAHFLVLPSTSLHSASILLAMQFGTIPIVTEVAGTSLYVTDRETAIVLNGARSLVAQLVERVSALLDSTEAYQVMSHRISERARTQFSGEKFASEFWGAVAERAQRAGNPARRPSAIAELTRSLRNCTLDSKTWSKVFESSAQPRPLLDTGTNKIFEVGGAVIKVPGNEPMDPTDWSVFARYFNTRAPKTWFADTLVELGPFLSAANYQGSALARHLRDWASNALIPFPKIHSLTSQGYHWIRRARTVASRWIR